jgi:hypothetical protein
LLLSSTEKHGASFDRVSVSKNNLVQDAKPAGPAPMMIMSNKDSSIVITFAKNLQGIVDCRSRTVMDIDS